MNNMEIIEQNQPEGKKELFDLILPELGLVRWSPGHKSESIPMWNCASLEKLSIWPGLNSNVNWPPQKLMQAITEN